MPHKCVRCGEVYFENAPELIRGCSCGTKVFLFVRNIEELKKIKDTAWIEAAIREYVSIQSKPIALEVENIRMLQRGVFEFNLKSLFSKEPIVLRDSLGIYYIKLPNKPSSAIAPPGK